MDGSYLRSFLFFDWVFAVLMVEEVLSDVLNGVGGSDLIEGYLSLASSVMACSSRGTTVLSRYCRTGMVFKSLL
jgi:hypothetical protein